MMTYHSNVKKIGAEFENEFCSLLSSKGYWVHFCTPNRSGAQPCDVIASKNGIPYMIYSKTTVKPIFIIKRMEDNQIFAMEKWISCGNPNPLIAIKHDGKVYLLSYEELKAKGKVDLRGRDDIVFAQQIDG